MSNNSTKVKHNDAPLLFMKMLPHDVWLHIAECSELKRCALVAQSSNSLRKDMKYLCLSKTEVFSFVLVLILSILQPSECGVKSHWRHDSTWIR